MRIAAILSAGITICLTSGCLAGAQDVSQALRDRAVQTCTSDAMRLCPEVIMDEGQVVNCMASKRPQLTQSCRAVYDQVARVLKE